MPPMIRHFRIASVVLLAAALVWVPLPFASVTRLGVVVVQGIAFTFLALVLAGVPRWRDLRPAAGPAVVLGLVALWGLVQSLPLPAGLLGWISPRHLELYAAAGVDGGALSLAPEASRRAAFLWLALAAVLVAAPTAGLHRLHRRVLAGAVLGAGLFQVVYGARRWFSTSTTIWGVEVPGSGARLRGTFVNPDHLALYLQLVLAVVFAWCWWAVWRARAEVGIERRLLLVVPPVLVWVTVFAGLTFTGSRGGILAGLFSLAVQAGLAATQVRRRSGRWRRTMGRGLAVGGGVIALGCVAILVMRQSFGRLLGTSPYELAWNTRTYAYRAVLDLWGQFPWLGSGLGTFRDTFSLVQTERLPGEWTHAHSAPLELGTTIGVVGLLLVGIGVFLLLRRLLVVWFDAPSSEGKAAALAALAALAAALAHEMVDFGLTMPANAFTLAVLCGVALGVPRRRRRSRRPRPSATPADEPDPE
jgi:O-antigen ligase